MRRLLALALALVSALAPGAQERPAEAPDLVVAVSPAPPFAEHGADSTWTGLGVDLAVGVGQALGRGVRFVGVAPDSAAAAVASGRADLALVALAPGVERSVDLSPAFVDADLAVARSAAGRLWAVAQRFFSPTFFRIAGALAVLLFVVGTLMWLVERRVGTEDFETGARGLWDGFWWAGVTMTTIGYGDTVPRTIGGRVLALVWMVLSLGVTAVLTVALIAALGIEGASETLRVPDDLAGERVAVVAGTPAARLLGEAGLDTVAFASAAAAVAALDADSVDAVAGSALRLAAAGATGATYRVATTGVTVERWALASADEGPLREPVARAVLDRIASADWPDVVRRHTD